jgi:ankyrin repeat protein
VMIARQVVVSTMAGGGLVSCQRLARLQEFCASTMPDGDSSAGLTTLSWAADEECDAVTKLLLERGADANSEDNNGQTPLLWAARGGYDAVVKQLLEKGAAVDSKDSTYGWTPMFGATMGRYDAVMMQLLEKEADVGDSLTR